MNQIRYLMFTLKAAEESSCFFGGFLSFFFKLGILMLGWGTASGEVRLMKSQTNSVDNEFLVKKQIANQLINKHIVDNSIFFDS